MDVCFFTVTHEADYDYLLGSIRHHAKMGRHLVLDTSEKAPMLRNLPSTVVWVHEPLYGSGWKTFRLRTALERAMNLALGLGPEILVYLDSDEFYSLESANNLFPLARRAALDLPIIHWCRDGIPRMFGPSEWHVRVWPSWARVRIAENEAWKVHPQYNGNPEHHAVVVVPPDVPVLRVPGLFLNHLHYFIGDKDDEVARQTIDGWPDRGHPVPAVDLPWPIQVWREKNVRPRESFTLADTIPPLPLRGRGVIDGHPWWGYTPTRRFPC
jgi:hypothetical protein